MLKQRLLNDHRKRLQYLYENIASKLKEDKLKVRAIRCGEDAPTIIEGDTVFMKNTRTRKAKHLPRYEKATITGDVANNTIPVKLKTRQPKVALKNVKRSSQVVADVAGPSSFRKRLKFESDIEKSRDSSDEAGESGAEEW